MSRGGVRKGAGRKKIGSEIKVILNDNLINAININFQGANRSEKIRQCLIKGLEQIKREDNNNVIHNK